MLSQRRASHRQIVQLTCACVLKTSPGSCPSSTSAASFPLSVVAAAQAKLNFLPPFQELCNFALAHPHGISNRLNCSRRAKGADGEVLLDEKSGGRIAHEGAKAIDSELVDNATDSGDL